MNISVIIPVFNATSTINRCIDSVLAQSHPVYEIIVIDDGSTDNSADKIRQYPGIKYLYQNNRGPSAARNKGVNISSGNFIAFLDSDDYWRPDHLKMITEPLTINPALKWSASAYVKESVTGKSDTVRLPWKLYEDKMISDYFLSTRRIHFLSTISVIIERSFFLTAGGFPEKYSRGEDLSLWLRLALIDPKLGYSPDATAFYMTNPNSLTATKNDLRPILQRIIDDYNLSRTQSDILQEQAWPIIRRWLFGVTIKSIKERKTDNLKQISDIFKDKLNLFQRSGLSIIQFIISKGKNRNVQEVGI